MTRFKVLSLGLMVGLMLVGCTTTPDKGDSYKGSVITPTLEIPPDLISRSSNKNLELPGSKVGSQENTGRFIETGNLNVQTNILPTFDDARLEGQGDMYWLVVSRPVEQVYPLIKQFWLEQGFKLNKDEPVLGIVETEWLRLKSGRNSFFANLLSSLRAAESLDQFHVRLERRSKETRIYLTHRNQELVIDEDSSAYDGTQRKQGWQRVPSDPAKEIEALSRLMVFFGMQDAQLKPALAKIGPFSPRATLEQNKDQEQEVLPFLMVSQGIDQTWNRLLYQLDRQAIAVVDKEKDQGKGTLVLGLAALAASGLELGEVKAASKVAISLADSVNSNRTRIDLVDNKSISQQQARQILQFLLEQLK